ncbi:MAG TPA: zinc-binding alcohol dehydrogenase family protein [Firmicutes bacterium]|nr:zinc-binding alcohol dehydrogenase family protein [Bacillota bacterium]
MPVVKEGEALLKIRYCGICGADVASYTGNQPFTTYPRIPGHEFSAEIVEIPENDKGLKPGDIVTANPYFNCQHCYSCERGFVNCCTDNQTMGVQRDGSFAEYVAMPVERIYPGKGLSAQQLALIEPFSISYHAVSRATVKPTDKVLVVGAGPIGLFAVIAAKLKGAQVYSADILDGRLQMAKEYGADGVINTKTQDLAEETKRITNGNGFDVCIEACGLSETFLSCIDCAAYAANIILIGNGKKETTFLHSILLKKELNVFGSRNSYAKDFTDLIDIVASGKVDVMKMVSGIYPMDRADEAFKALAHNDGSLAKLLVEVSK